MPWPFSDVDWFLGSAFGPSDVQPLVFVALQRRELVLVQPSALQMFWYLWPVSGVGWVGSAFSFQFFSLFFRGDYAANEAAAISRISWVMAAWRALLYSSVRSPMSLVALSFAVFIATMRELCSEALALRMSW